jgi:hypothetical protein
MARPRSRAVARQKRRPGIVPNKKKDFVCGSIGASIVI